jgi:hypothetical protein
MKEPKRYYCGIGEGMFEDNTNGHWIKYSEHKAIVEELNQALRIHDVVGRSEQLACVHPYGDVYQSETECYCEKCGKDLTEAS